MKQNVPSLTSREMKINSVHSYGGEENGINFLKSEIEDLLNIKIACS